MAKELERSRRSDRGNGFILVLSMAAVMWVAEIIDVIIGHRLDQYGIEPRDTDGLVGIGASPFLHGDFGHLIGNTIPFLIMGFVIAMDGLMRVIAVTLIVAVVGGLGTWLVAPESTIHIGASGIVFGYGSYLISRGFFDRDLVYIAIGLVVAVVWGGAFLSGLVPQEGVSWQGHLFGAIGGVVASRVLARQREREAAPA